MRKTDGCDNIRQCDIELTTGRGTTVLTIYRESRGTRGANKVAPSAWPLPGSMGATDEKVIQDATNNGEPIGIIVMYKCGKASN